MDTPKINYEEILRLAQPSWVKDGKGLRGDAVTEVRSSVPPSQNPGAFAKQRVRQEPGIS